MNPGCFGDIEETDDFQRVRLAVQNGWLVLDIYKPKREIEFSNGQFEEYAVYILAKPADDASISNQAIAGKLQKRAVVAAITEVQRAVLGHERTLTAETEAEQHQHSQAAKQSMLEAIRWLECLE